MARDKTLDYVFLYKAQQGERASVHYLCYEIQRDFHSLPRAYALVSFQTSTVGGVVLDVTQRYACFSYDEDGLCEQRGLFLLEHSAEVNARDSLHFFMSTPQGALEVICASLTLVGVLYHEVSAQTALLAGLQRINCI